MRVWALTTLALATAGCGGSSGDRITGALSAQFKGAPFAPMFGAVQAGGYDGMDQPVAAGMTLHLSTAEVGCATDFKQGFPLGTYIEAGLPSQSAGAYTGVSLKIEQFTRTSNGFNEMIAAANTAVILIQNSGAASIDATFTFSYTATEGTSSVNGPASIRRCF
jgi:hypothetical protein